MDTPGLEVNCEKCGHKWQYKGKANVIRCPRRGCHSSRNLETRRRRGGPWTPKLLFGQGGND